MCVLKLSMVSRQLSILIFLLFFSPSIFAQPEYDDDSAAFTQEVTLALKYDRCQDALNMLMEKEVAGDTLSAHHRYLMAEAYSCMGSFKTAIGIYTDLLKEDKGNAIYLQRRATLYAQLQSWKKAYADCARLKSLMPRERSYCKLCSEVALEAKQHGSAVDFAGCRLQADSLDADAQYVLARAYQGMKEYGTALLVINKCIDAAPLEAKCYLLRAEVYEQLDVRNFAADDYAVYLKYFSTDHRVWLRYGLLLHGMGRKPEACKALEQARANGNLDAGRYIYRYCR